jgi:hypothetical protein
MERIDNWNTIDAKGMEDFVTLPMGGYKFVVKFAGEHISKNTGNKMLKICVDIADGEFKDYFQKKFDNDNRTDKKWDNNATKYFVLGSGFMKGFITTMNNSNSGLNIDCSQEWNEQELVNKYAACSFEPEENEYNGAVNVKIKLNKFRSLDKLNSIEVKNIRLLDNSYVDYAEYKSKGSPTVTAESIFGPDIVSSDVELDL